MPQEPKKRHSRARQGKRRHSIRLTPKKLTTCSNCGNKRLSHIVCPNCGFYNGKSTRNTTVTTPIKTPPSA